MSDVDIKLDLQAANRLLKKLETYGDNIHNRELGKAIKAGANSYLVKPFSPEKLATRIQELL